MNLAFVFLLNESYTVDFGLLNELRYTNSLVALNQYLLITNLTVYNNK